jgi:hypothetical protein
MPFDLMVRGGEGGRGDGDIVMRGQGRSVGFIETLIA